MTASIGAHRLAGRAVLAPMAGVTDRPFRMLCRELGAALTPAEMLTADQRLWHTPKSQRRLDHDGECEPRVVQLLGNDPWQLAEAARMNVALGAQIIDLNMGCPAKQVCQRAAGSALLANESLVGRLFDALVRAVPVPITVKIRTGPDPRCRNAPRIAALAQRCGLAAVAIHGRTRADAFRGQAEHHTARRVRTELSIPLIVNGDIDCAHSASAALTHSGAAAVMIGRAAQGAPWIFRDVNAYLSQGHLAPPLLRTQKSAIILRHLDALYAFYGERDGVRMARKHLGWYCSKLGTVATLRPQLMAAEDSASQFALARRGFEAWANQA